MRWNCGGGRLIVAQEDVCDGEKQLGVFGGTAHGDADGFGETHPGHRTNDDAFLKEFIAKSFGVRTDRHKEEICFAEDRIETELAEFFEKALPFDAIHFGGSFHVLVIVERGECGGLANAGYIERRAELIHFRDQRGMANAVADAQAR
jgi:hypothetical protein